MEDKILTYKGVSYELGETIRLYTGNADGSIPSEEDFQGTIETFLQDDRAILRTSRGNLTTHVAGFRKLEAGLLSGQPSSAEYHKKFGNKKE